MPTIQKAKDLTAAYEKLIQLSGENQKHLSFLISRYRMNGLAKFHQLFSRMCTDLKKRQ